MTTIQISTSNRQVYFSISKVKSITASTSYTLITFKDLETFNNVTGGLNDIPTTITPLTIKVDLLIYILDMY